MNLYVTGTLMHNRIPAKLTIKKNSAAYRSLARGHFKTHTYSYKDNRDKTQTIGVTCWKDRQMVYTLTTESDTATSGECVRRTREGLITIDRPNVVKEYNENMGGVDLADMRRLHVQTNIIGLHRWWVRLFFYLLDVGTSNAMILYSSTKNDNEVNLASFKRALVWHFVGDMLSTPVSPANTEQRHLLVRISDEEDLRSMCTYCSMVDRQRHRTRYKCAFCHIPLCSQASGKRDRDCFALAHETPSVLEMLKQHHNAQKKRTSIRYRKN